MALFLAVISGIVTVLLHPTPACSHTLLAKQFRKIDTTQIGLVKNNMHQTITYFCDEFLRAV